MKSIVYSGIIAACAENIMSKTNGNDNTKPTTVKIKAVDLLKTLLDLRFILRLVFLIK